MPACSRWLAVTFAVFLVLLACADGGAGDKELSGSKLEEKTEKLQGVKNSSMAGRIGDERNKHAIDNPEDVASMVDMSIRNSTERRNLGFFSCGTGNPIDDCWRCDPKWYLRRKHLADCAIGFGRNAVGGRDGRYYVVSDPGDDDPVSPRPGTLRHAVIQDRPLWIVFKRDMVIHLKQELIMNSFKTIDGRGANVHIANGACITIQYITNVIIHGVSIHDCKPTGNAMVRSSPSHYGWRTMADGDGISIFGASHIWIDHNSLSNCADGLIDAIMSSTAITISNNYFTHHNEVMLLGHSDSYVRDKSMQVTIAYNHFGEGLIQRMPRCRHGYFHVVNNDYTHWEMYAIGGSAEPTINSQGNRYLAPLNPFAKEVTKRVDTSTSQWKSWNWRSEGDLLLNGAFFTPSGAGAGVSYARASSLGAKSSSLVGTLTSNAGVLVCRRGRAC
ncbi:probable pectate lyase 8 [Rhodamnia argentea]|uniref:Pectate lyase n=1 Tax=Rhodamnia argentea TaxID=178133 RepID=A0A8B8PDH8_9MYRT|nr:probable pectate lyase 8 [Rhodamnia argentea]XP_030532629.2 probable pectate lyase 8 [Rhodamnia argentea]XP_030532630.2 probable pectate lyase 8 [Rhodamnia argentea]